MLARMSIAAIAALVAAQSANAEDPATGAVVAPPVAASAATPTTPAEPTTAQVAQSAQTVAAQAETAATAPAWPGLAPTVAADGCELHIWPAERMQSQSTGWLGGFGMLGAIADQASSAKANSNRQALLASALDSHRQLESLLALDLRTLLGRTPGTTLVVHDVAPERHTINSIKTRRSDSAAQCYSELIVADVLFQKNAILGRSLKTLFMLRDFGADQKIDKEYKAWGGNGVSLFPPKEGDDATPALEELVTTYKKNFDEYARNARTALARARK
jgi:hypothetical protein